MFKNDTDLLKVLKLLKILKVLKLLTIEIQTELQI